MVKESSRCSLWAIVMKKKAITLWLRHLCLSDITDAMNPLYSTHLCFFYLWRWSRFYFTQLLTTSGAAWRMQSIRPELLNVRQDKRFKKEAGVTEREKSNLLFSLFPWVSFEFLWVQLCYFQINWRYCCKNPLLLFPYQCTL